MLWLPSCPLLIIIITPQFLQIISFSMQALMHKVGRGFWILKICIQTPLIKTKILKKPFSKWFRLCCWQSSVRVWKHNWFTGPPSNHSTSSSISAAFTLNTQCIMWGKVTIGSPVRQPTNTLHIARHTKTLIMHITKCIYGVKAQLDHLSVKGPECKCIVDTFQCEGNTLQCTFVQCNVRCKI